MNSIFGYMFSSLSLTVAPPSADLRGRGAGAPGSSLCSSGKCPENSAVWHRDERSVGLTSDASAAPAALERTKKNERSVGLRPKGPAALVALERHNIMRGIPS